MCMRDKVCVSDKDKRAVVTGTVMFDVLHT